MKLAYTSWGPKDKGSATKLVLLHGMGGTGTLWRPIAAQLEEEFQLLGLDQRGHGKSQIPHTPGGRQAPKYTPLDYGRDVIETIEALQFHPTWVLGHSMGVRTACAAAHLKPDWVSGLILVDLGFSGVAGGGLGEELARFMKNLPSRFASRAEAREFMQHHSPDPSIGQYVMAVSILNAKTGEVTFPFDQAALIETIMAARDVSVREWIKEAGARGTPVLVIRGAESGVWSREQFKMEKKNLAEFPSIQFIEIAGAGHGLPFEKRAEFSRIVREFIGQNSNR